MAADVRVRFAKRLKELRQEKSYSVPELARRSGVSRWHICDLELPVPQKRVTIVTLEKLARGLAVPLWELLKFSG